MTLYVKTTEDKYELPLIVEDSYHKLAEKTGIKAKSVANMCCTEKGGYYKVKLEKGEELE
ncbi:MAG: hypothetical protein IIY21_15520 [Clostridiales bacterium]|jgi:hypothetical protein|nr:hypothetical protein [Clostridiales bacterium]